MLDLIYKFLAIEGIAYSGKTTLSKELCSLTEINRLPELAELFENGALFPKIPNNELETQLLDIWFIEQTKNRNKEILNSLKYSNTIIDRYYLSNLAYVYSRSKTFEKGNYFYNRDLTIELITKKIIMEPWFIYLRIDIDTFVKRKELFGNARLREKGEKGMQRIEIKNNETQFIYNQISFFDSYFCKNSNSLILNGCDSFKHNILKINEWLIHLPSKLPNTDYITKLNYIV